MTTNDSSVSPTLRALSSAGTHEELILGSRAYCREAARERDLDVDFSLVDWEVSTRAKRRAAAVKRPKIQDATVGDTLAWDELEPRKRECTVSLTWAAFESFDTAEWASTLRHELIHVEQFQQFGTTGHGAAFKQRAETVGASIRCPSFAEAKYVLRCGTCAGVVARRYRDCDLVREPGQYRSSCCEAELSCESVRPE